MANCHPGTYWHFDGILSVDIFPEKPAKRGLMTVSMERYPHSTETQDHSPQCNPHAIPVWNGGLWISVFPGFKMPAFNFLNSPFCTKDQKSFFFPPVLIAFGWSMASPSMSQRNSWRVRRRASEAFLGHWNRPLPSRRFWSRTKPSLSKWSAFSFRLSLPQKR